MRKYEGLFIFESGSGQDAKKIEKIISEVIEKQDGKIEQVTDWGRRKFGYLIKKKREGIFCLVNFTLDPGQMSRIESLFNLNEQILKFSIFLKKKIRPIKIRRPLNKKTDANKVDAPKAVAAK